MNSSSPDWEQLIARAAAVNRSIASADVNSIWNYGGPRTPAGSTEAFLWQVDVTFDLGDDYRKFLSISDGWRGFYHDVDLLSASELLGGERFDRAWMLVEAADAGSGGSLGVSRDLYVPCGVAAVDIDVFLIGVTGESSSVRWIAGQEVERFDSFGEFFEEMISYNEETLEELRLDPWLGAG